MTELPVNGGTWALRYAVATHAPTLVPANGGETLTLLAGPSGENVIVARPAPEGPSPLLQACARRAALASTNVAAPRLNEPRSPGRRRLLLRFVRLSVRIFHIRFGRRLLGRLLERHGFARGFVRVGRLRRLGRLGLRRLAARSTRCGRGARGRRLSRIGGHRDRVELHPFARAFALVARARGSARTNSCSRRRFVVLSRSRDERGRLGLARPDDGRHRRSDPEHTEQHGSDGRTSRARPRAGRLMKRTAAGRREAGRFRKPVEGPRQARVGFGNEPGAQHAVCCDERLANGVLL